MKRNFCAQTALLCICFLLIGCQNEGLTPDMNYTELWPAGVTCEIATVIDDDEPYHEDELYGYINRQGEMVIKPQFVSAGSFSCGYAPVTLLGPEKKHTTEIQQLAFIDKKGDIHAIVGLPDMILQWTLTPFYYNTAILYGSPPASVGNYTYSWMVDNSMKVVSDYIYPGNLSHMTKDGLAACMDYNVLIGDYNVMINVRHYDKSGQKVLQWNTVVDGDPNFNDGYAVLALMNDTAKFATPNAGNTKYCIVDTKGQIVYEDSHVLMNLGHERFLRKYDTLYSADQFDVIDKYGHLLESDQFKAPKWNEEQLFLVESTRQEQMESTRLHYYYVNQNGKQTFDRSFSYAEPFVNGYAVVIPHISYENMSQEHCYEIINMKGETVLTLEPGERTSGVHNGLILTRKSDYNTDDKYKYVIYYSYKDLSGKVIYSWQNKILKGKKSLPSKKENANTVTCFPDGLYILGNN